MTDASARWKRVEALCHAALELEPAARGTFLTSACGTDAMLRREVESLIAHARTADGFLAAPIGAVAADVLGVSATVRPAEAVSGLIGRRIGSYDVIGRLGAGGMGEVYRARDAALGRDVAIKVLPSAITADFDRLPRFEREARVLASLNHPHIGAIYGIERIDDVPALVLELVEGETLVERIGGRGLPVDEAVAIARQIAGALGAAHEQGIIHRDLKPANVKITPAGVVKVLDFGLAKAAASSGPDLSFSPTLSGTQEGVVMGTAAYMSPEQARGQVVDKRTDIWAFGCVLYELLTGRMAFNGATVSDYIAAILEREPDWSALPAETPAAIRTLLEQCLKKDRTQRLGDMAVAQFLLDAPPTLTSSASLRAVASAAPPASRSRTALTVLASAAAAAVLTAGALWTRPAAPAGVASVTRFAAGLPAGQTLANNGVGLVAISPDGTRFVYVANDQLYVRAADQLEPQPIKGTNEQPAEPFFSPDGQWVGYWAKGQLKKIAITGGAPVPLCAIAETPNGVSWKGDRIVFATNGEGILEVPANGGVPKVLIPAEPGFWFHDPHGVPGADAIVFAVKPGGAKARWDDSKIVVQALKTGVRKTLVAGAFGGRVLETGHLVYVRDNVLLAQTFDVSRQEVTGGPVPLVDGVSEALAVYLAGVQFDVSRTGTLVYLKGAFTELRTLVWRDRQGRETPIPAPPKGYGVLRISPDGTRIAFDSRDRDNGIWIWDIGRESLTRFTSEGENSPIWTHDSKRIIYSSADWLQMLIRPADGNGEAEVLMTSDRQLQPSVVTPDGKQLVFWPQGADNDMMVLDLSGDHTPRLLPPKTSFFERHPALSSDGRWIAFESNEPGYRTIFVRPFPDTGRARWQISTEAGTRPLWAPNGRELYYVSPRGELMSVAVQTAPDFVAGKPLALFDAVDPRYVNRPFDITSDGARFVFAKELEDPSKAQFVVVQNWFEELKARVPIK